MAPREAESTGKLSPFVRFLLLALGILAALIALGLVPTRRLGGERAVEAMLAGCSISLIASAIGVIAVRAFAGLTSRAVIATATGAMALRLFVVLALAVSVIMAGWFELRPLLLWVAISHAGLLVADTKYSLEVLVGTQSETFR